MLANITTMKNSSLSLLLILTLISCKPEAVTVKLSEAIVIDEEGELKTLTQGLHWVSTSAIITTYDLTQIHLDESISVLTLDSLITQAKIKVGYSPDTTNLNQLHKRFGPSYHETLVIPEARHSTRKIFSQVKSNDINASRLKAIEKEILDDLNQRLFEQGVTLYTFILNDYQDPRIISLVRELNVVYENLISNDLTIAKPAIDEIANNKSTEAIEILLDVYSKSRSFSVKKYIVERIALDIR